MVQGIKQFNGKYGCSWCLHPGQQVDKGNGKVRIYSAQKHDLRNHATFVDHVKKECKRRKLFWGDACFTIIVAA
jgi:hypothetical protein